MRTVMWWLGTRGVALVLLGGCAKGVESDGLSFGPVDPTNSSVTTFTSGPPDSTTNGMTSPMTTGADTDDDGAVTMTAADSTTGPEASTGPGAESSSTGPAGPICGDDVADPGEACDGIDLAGMTCPQVDPTFTGGTLACDAGCAFDTSTCSSAENPIVVCQVVNGAIPDNSVVGLTSTITLPPETLGGTITDVNVEVEIDHTYIGDLEIDLTASGTNLIMFNSCLTEDNLHVVFDDAGGVLNCAASDLGSTVLPAQPLSALNGSAVESTWTLFVEDQANIDTGTLQQWCVTIAWM